MRLLSIKTFILLAIFTASLGIASKAIASKAEPAAETQCHEKEIDYRSRKPFVSKEAHSAEKQHWDATSRPQIGIFELLQAYAVFRMERTRALALKSDKAKHCYIGCVVGLATSPKVADYLGWLKEDLDLSDCDGGTLYEPADQVATSLGARLGARDKKECAIYCRDHFSKGR